MCNSEEEYEDWVLKESEEIVDEFQREHGFNDENMVRVLEDTIEIFKKRIENSKGKSQGKI